MKVRLTLVANSSSSNYIIAVKGVDTCPHCHRSDPDFLSGMSRDEGYSSNTTRVILDDFNEIIKMVGCEFYPDDRKPLIAKIKKYQKDPSIKKIAYIKVNYHDQLTNDLLQSGIQSGSIIKIHDDRE